MNDKHDFLERLSDALLERDLSKADIAPYLERFDRFYDRMASDPDKNTAALLEDVESIADKIAEQVAERYDRINDLAERTMSMDAVKSDSHEAPPVKASAEATPEAESTPSAEPEPEFHTASEPIFVPTPVKAPEPPPAEDADALETTEYDSKLIERTFKAHDGEDAPPAEYIDGDEAPSGTLFWVLFGVSLPITLPLALVGLAVFVAAWAALAAVGIASAALLVVGAGVGAALSLVGVIYGITQLFVSFPVGLYEIGLGVMIAGVVMFCGILLYNVAIRLVPWVSRLVAKLLGCCVRRLGVLFNYLRRECAKL